MAGVRHVANTNQYRCKYCADAGRLHLQCADEVAETIEFEGPETVAMVIMEPVQNAGGSLHAAPAVPPARARDLRRRTACCRCADEVICGFGRVGEWFGSIRYDYRPDLMTTAKGLTSAYQPHGRRCCSPTAWPSACWRRTTCTCTASRSAATRSPPPSRSRTSRSWSARACIDNVRANQGYLEDALRGLMARHEIIGDVRGAGYFWAIELVKDRATRETFTPRSATSCCATSCRTRCSTRA